MLNKELENNYKGEEDNYNNGNYKKRNKKDQMLKKGQNNNVWNNRDQLDNKNIEKNSRA